MTVEQATLDEVDESEPAWAGLGLEWLSLSTRAVGCLKRTGIDTVGELVLRSEADLLDIRNFGRKSVLLCILRLSERGLQLAPDAPDLTATEVAGNPRRGGPAGFVGMGGFDWIGPCRQCSHDARQHRPSGMHPGTYRYCSMCGCGLFLKVEDLQYVGDEAMVG